MKRIHKHETTSSYYHLVGCIAECMLRCGDDNHHVAGYRYFHLVWQLAKCMMRSDEHNQHVHGSYTEMTDLSSNLNVTDKDESKEIIAHETLSENQYK